MAAPRRLWHYLINTFLVCTQFSYRSMKKIGDFTVNALFAVSSTPFFYDLYTALVEPVNDFKAKYLAWVTALGEQESDTTALYLEIESLRSEKIRKWDIKIQSVYDIKTPGYVRLLPNRRKPFQVGSQEDIMTTVQALGERLIGETALVPLKVEVMAFGVTMQELYDEQKASIGLSGTSSTAVEEARITLGQELFSTVGLLMSHFKTNPESIASFFDLQTIRNFEQSIWNRKVGPKKLISLFKRTLAPTEQIKITNQALAPLRFAFLLNKDDEMGLVYVEVPPLSSTIKEVSDFGPSSNIFFKVLNITPDTQGKFFLIII